VNPFQKNKTICIKFWLDYDREESPQVFYSSFITKYKPTRRQWLPQTLGDQIWMWFEFDSVKTKKAVLLQLDDKAKSMLQDNITQYDLNYWSRL
jgi:hypothetical protein